MGIRKQKTTSTTEVFRRNLNHLKDLNGDSSYSIGDRAKMPQRTVSRILSGEQDKISIEQADLLASAYGLEGWHLLLPDLPNDLVKSPSLGNLYKSYIGASPEGREMIDKVAEREARYEKNKKTSGSAA